MKLQKKPNNSFYLTHDEKKALLETRSLKHGRTPFHHLARCGIRFDNGIMISTLSTSSFSAPEQKDYIRSTEYLLVQAENLGVNAHDLINVQEKPKKWTPLAWAAYTGNEMMVDLFLDHGAKASLKTNDNRTPVMLADESREKVSRLGKIQTMPMDMEHYKKIASRFSYISSVCKEAMQGKREGGGINI